MDDPLLDIHQVSQLLNISRETIYREVRAGRIPGAKVGGQWRFSETAVRVWFESHSTHGREGHGVFADATNFAEDVIQHERSSRRDGVPANRLP